MLYIVATPIGNLEDITLRALRVLKEADLIAAEDTRHTKTLLTRYDIHVPLTSYHEHNERVKARELVARLERGQNVALVSDAGTPTLSDPGYRLVRDALKAAIRVVPVPGPSAVTAVLSVSGLPTDRFVFEGFLPAKKGERKARLHNLVGEARSLVFFEAPHRIRDTLGDMLEHFGDREVVLAREATKAYEEFLRGRLSVISAALAAREPRGEFTVVVRGSETAPLPSQEFLLAEIRKLKGKGLRVKEIAELLSERYSCSKKEVYRLAVESLKTGP
ncbi:MAG: 16S rRNA (cytidine(1402)-2'-O)-methyltransferase [Deltaproteobacteria bacterium]|nr:16S rRNA (cytidine(1402)-2'-O)-methyltransferase [Deltaproteobacteria bacterium]